MTDRIVWSEVQGCQDPPPLEQTVGEALRLAADAWPDTQALISVEQNIRWTYAELNRRANQLATGLMSLGLSAGDRLGIWSPNCAEWTLTQFATGKAGIILVNINPAYRLSELEFTLNKVGVKALICARSFKSSNYLDMLEAIAPEILSFEGSPLQALRLPHLRFAIQISNTARPGWLNFSDVCRSGGDHAREAANDIRCEQPINIQFSSGTTGLPKAATLSHRNIVNNAYFVGRAVGLRPQDRLCIPVPLYHCFGMVMSNLACVLHGATMVYPSAGFDPLAVLQTIANEKCTILYGVPTMYIAQLDHPRFLEFDLSSLRGGIMSGAPCPIEIMHRVVESMHMHSITIAYGMTETSPVSFQSSIDDELERRVTTVGRIQPHVQCKLVDLDGSIVPRGDSGEVCIRGYSVMLGYWDDPEKTSAAIDSEGWMHSGDLGRLDADGYAQIIGRRTDMIIRGGENVYPRELEEFLFRHPDIADVAVIGVPDSKFGEAVCAWVKLRGDSVCTESAIKEFCRDQIAHYKIPKYVLFVAEIPTTVTGKVRKNVMREESAKLLALSPRIVG